MLGFLAIITGELMDVFVSPLTMDGTAAGLISTNEVVAGAERDVLVAAFSLLWSN
jgi:hypothetical protein